MDKTCKSDARQRVAIFVAWSGVRVRNTWVICLEARDNSEKSELIPDVTKGWHHPLLKVGDRKA